MTDRPIRESIADLAPDERRRLLTQTENMIAVIMKEVQVMGRHAVDGVSPAYRDAWQMLIDKRRAMASSLEEIKQLLQAED